jgi:hypothetical protein
MCTVQNYAYVNTYTHSQNSPQASTSIVGCTCNPGYAGDPSGRTPNVSVTCIRCTSLDLNSNSHDSTTGRFGRTYACIYVYICICIRTLYAYMYMLVLCSCLICMHVCTYVHTYMYVCMYYLQNCFMQRGV